MTDNMRIWNALEKTDPKHTKQFQRPGGFRGTAIKPIYATLKMTELFGPCGHGWGMDKPDFTTITVGDEILVYCTVGLWYREEAGADAKTVWGVGGDKVASKNRDGRLATDDEAFKKAYTDALSNAMKQIGVGADVHMGQFDDAKYVNDLRREFSEADTKEQSRRPAADQKQGKTAGSTEPYVIPVPPTEDGSAADWKGWVATLRAFIHDSRSIEEVNTWMQMNQVPLGNLEKASKEAAKFIRDFAEKKRGILAQAPADKQVA
ncbi:MAG TPA: hypothetical protein VIK75_10180 [Calditerricola sp.]